MPPTTIRGKQVLDGSIQRADLDTTTVGQAVVAKLVQGTNIALSSTGADAGTGDVTVGLGAHQTSHVTGGDQIPSASSSVRGLLTQVSGLTTDFVDGTNACQDLTSASAITLMRLRSFNAVGNSTFEVDQRQCHGSSSMAAGSWICDRWHYWKAGTMVSWAQSGANFVAAPGTSQVITSYAMNTQLTTQQVSLGASDSLQLYQSVEGPNWRELAGGVHSLSVMVASSVASLKFGVALQDSPATKSLTLLGTTSATPNTFTLVQWPNLPAFPSANFSAGPGLVGYNLIFTLAAGSSITSSANGMWQNGSFIGAAGQSNFAASAVNSLFYVAFIQHEPGPNCTTPIDKPFFQNYDECLRYYQKTWDYDIAVGTASAVGYIGFAQQVTTGLAGNARFHKPMAKVPTMVSYSTTGAVNTIRLNGVDYTSTNFAQVGKAGFSQLTTATLPAVAAGNTGLFHYTADTGF